MKKFVIVIGGTNEDQIGHEILQGIYAAVQNNGYADVSVSAETLPERKQNIDIPAFVSQRGGR